MRTLALAFCAAMALTIGSIATAKTATHMAMAPTVNIGDNTFTFDPVTKTVPVGTTVTWTNNDPDGSPHTVTADDGSWTSDDLNQGDTYQHTFTKVASVGYHCKYHGSPGKGMHGTIVVTAATMKAKANPKAKK